MRKLKLDLDHLAVQSFGTASAAGESHGTVRGHGGRNSIDVCEALPHDYTEVSCPPYTQAASCYGTCYNCGGGGSGYYTCGGFSCREEYTCYPEAVPPDP